MKIGVVGTRGGWSSELLADTVAAKTGFRLLVDMEQVCLDLDSGKAWIGGVDLGGLDGLIIKKIGARYSPDLLDRLELLRFSHNGGLAHFFLAPVHHAGSGPPELHRDPALGGIPMPPTTITESVDEAWARWSATARRCSSPSSRPRPGA
jgi:hypothetical protein